MQNTFTIYATNSIDREPIKIAYDIGMTGAEVCEDLCKRFNIIQKSNLTFRFLDLFSEESYVNYNLALPFQGMLENGTIFVLPNTEKRPLPRANSQFIDIPDVPDFDPFTPQEKSLNEQENVDVNLHEANTDFKDLDFGFGADESSTAKDESELHKIEMFNGFSEENPKLVTVENSHSKEDVIAIALSTFGLPGKEKYEVLIKLADETYVWMGDDKFISDYSISAESTLRICKEKTQIKIKTETFSSTKYKYDVKMIVRDLIKIVCDDKGLVNSGTYALFTREVDGEKEYWSELRPELTLFEQINELGTLKLKKRYFIITREDLMSKQNALCIYKEVKNELHRTKSYIPHNTAVEIAAYSAISDVDKFTLSAMPRNFSSVMPKQFQSDNFVKEVQKYIRGMERYPDQINAIRLFIKLVRVIPGFTADKFKIKTDSKVEELLLISPLGIYIINKETERLNTFIPHQAVLDVSSDGESIKLSYSPNVKTVSTIVRFSSRADDICFRIVEIMNIFRDIFVNRAILRAQGKWDGPQIQNSSIELVTFLGPSDKDTHKAYNYDVYMSGDQLTEAAASLFNLTNPDEYKVLLQLYDKSYKYISPNQILSFLPITPGSPIHLIKRIQKVKITTTDGYSKQILIDVSKTVKELIFDIFKELEFSPVYGYALFYKNEGVSIPFSDKFSMPEQCKTFRDLEFKRIHFVLSKKDMQTDDHSWFAYSDVKAYVMNNFIEATEDQLVELAILNIFVGLSAPEQIKDINVFEYKELFPTWFKLTPKTQQKFLDSVHKYKLVDRFSAMRSYIRIAREINLFGSISYPYKILNSKGKICDGKIIFCPLFVYFIKNEKVMYKVFYKYIYKFKLAGEKLRIHFLDTVCNEKTRIEFTSPDAQTILSTFSTYICIHQDLMHERNVENKEKESLLKLHLHGGFEDEDGIHGPQRNYQISTDIHRKACLPTVWLDLAYTQETVINKIVKMSQTDGKMSALNENDKSSYIIYNSTLGLKEMYIKPGMTIEECDCVRGSTMFIIKGKQKIEIATLAGQKTALEIDVTQKVIDVIEMAAKKLNIDNYIWYTLWVDRGKQFIPLDLYKTLPEQAADFNYLTLRRRFFNIGEVDFGLERIFHTFIEYQYAVTHTKFSVTEDEAATLIAMNLIIDKSGKIKESDVPNDFTKYGPDPFNVDKPPKSLVKKVKAIISSQKHDVLESTKKYILTASGNPTFGNETFNATVNIDDSTNKIVISVTPQGICTKDLDTIIGISLIWKKIPSFVDWEHIIDVRAVSGEFSIKYIKGTNEACYISGTSKEAAELASLIRQYQSVLSKCTWFTKGQNLSDMTRMFSLRRPYQDVGHSVPANFDIRLSGEEIAELSKKYLYQNKYRHYTSMIQYSNEDLAWVRPKHLLGEYHPFHGMKMILYNSYAPIIIQTPGSLTKKIIIDCTLRVIELVPFLAERLYIENPIGYTIYVKLDDGMVPLDLDKTIPEQVDISSKFVFKKRFFVITDLDLDSPIATRQLYSDYKGYILSGKVNVSETQMLELATYSHFAQADNPNTASHMDEFTDMSPYLPFGMPNKDWYPEKIRQLVSSIYLDNFNAMRNYIGCARGIMFFGCENFECQIKQHKDVNGKKTFFYKAIIISIGPNGVQFIRPETMSSSFSFGFNAIINAEFIDGGFVIHLITTEGKGAYFPILSDKSMHIVNLINEYRRYVLPAIKARRQLQMKYLHQTERYMSACVVYSALSMDFPTPNLITIDKMGSSEKNIRDLVKFYILDDAKGRVPAIRTLEGLKWQEDRTTLDQFGVKNNDIVYFIQPVKEVFVTTASGLITKISIDLRKNVSEVVAVAGRKLGLGDMEGMTFYPGNTPDFPMEINYPIPTQTNFVHELLFKRRYFAVKKGYFKEDINTEAFFSEVRVNIIDGKIRVPDEMYSELAMLEIATQSPDAADFSKRTKDVDLSQHVPFGYRVTVKMQERFKTLCRSSDKFIGVYAMRKYIALCANQKGFGTEEHKCIVTDVLDLSKKPYRQMTIVMGPFDIAFKEEKRVITHFDYVHLITAACDQDGSLRIKFINELNRFCEYVIQSERLYSIKTFILEMMTRHSSNNYILTAKELIDAVWEGQIVKDQKTTIITGKDMELFNVTMERPPSKALRANSKSIIYCGDNFAIFSASQSIELALKAVNNLIMETKEEKEANRQIREAAEYFKESIKRLDDRAAKLSKGKEIESMRSDALYVAENCLDMIQDIMDVIGVLGKRGYDSEKLREPLSVCIQPLNEAILWISTINISPTSIQSVIDDLADLSDSLSKMDKSKLSQKSSILVEKTIEHINEIYQNADRRYQSLKVNTIKYETVTKIQEDLHELLSLVPDIEKAITDLSNKDDISLQLKFEKMVTNLENALSEVPPTEEFSTCPHIVRLHQAMHDLSVLIGTVFQVADIPQVKENADLKEQVHVVSDFIHGAYAKVGKARFHLHLNPYEADVIKEALDSLKHIEKYIGLFQQLSMSLSQYIKEDEVGLAITTLIKSIKLATTTLENTEARSYRPPPRIDTQLNALQNIIHDVISTLVAIQNSEDNNSGKINYAIKVEIEYFQRKDAALKILFQKPDPEYYDICEKVRARVAKFPVKFVDSPQIRKSVCLADLIESTTKSVNAIIRPIQPTITTAHNYLRSVIQTLNLVISFADSVQNSIPQQYRDDKFKSFVEWKEKIIDVYQFVFDHEKAVFYTVAIMKSDLYKVLEIEELIDGLPYLMRPFMDDPNKERMAVLICNAAAACLLFTNCAINVRKGIIIGLDMICFKLIDPNEDAVYASQEILKQFNIYSDVVTQLLRVPSVRARPHTRDIISEVVSFIGNTAQSFSSSMDDREKLIQILESFNSSSSDFVNRVKLVSPIVNVENLYNAAVVVAVNGDTVWKILKRQHLTDGAADMFATKAWPIIKAAFAKLQETALPGGEYDPQLSKYIEASKFMTVTGLTARRKEALCDRIYTTTAALLAPIIDNVLYQNQIDPLFEIYKASEEFTSAKKVNILYTAGLAVTSSPFTPDQISNIVEMVAAFLNSDSSNISGNLLRALLEALGQINEHPEGLPIFVTYAANVMYQHLVKAPAADICRGVLPIVLASPDQKTAYLSLIQLVILAYRRVSRAIAEIKQQFKEIEIPETASKEAKYYNKWFIRAISKSDTNILNSSNTLSAVVLIYANYHEVETLLYNLCVYAKEQTELLNEAKDNLSKWLFNADTLFQNLFFLLLGYVSTSLEAMQIMDGFYKHCAILLKANDRALSPDHEITASLARLYLGAVFEPIRKYKPCADKEICEDNIQIIESFRPVVYIWSDPFSSMDMQRFRTEIVASCAEISQSTKTVVVGPNFISDISYPLSRSTYMRLISAKATEKGIDINKVIGLISRLNATINRSRASESTEELDNIDDLINAIFRYLAEEYPLNPEIDLDGSSIDSITDPACRQAAISAKSFLDAINRQISLMPKDEKQQRNKSLLPSIQMNYLSQEVAARNIRRGMSRKPDDELCLEDELWNDLRHADLLLQLALLKQQQLEEIAGLQEIMDKPIKVAEIISRFGDSEIHDAIDLIMAQLPLLNDQEKLRALQSGIGRDDFVLQQALISRFMEMISDGKFPVEDANIDDYIAQAKIKSANLKADASIVPQALRCAQEMRAKAILAMHINAITSFMLANGNTIYKFAATTEGKDAMTKPLSIRDVMKAHKGISIQISADGTAEILRHIQSQLSADESIKQIRIMQDMLRLIYADCVSGLTPSELYDNICAYQLEKLGTEAFKIKQLTDTKLASELTLKAEDMIKRARVIEQFADSEDDEFLKLLKAMMEFQSNSYYPYQIPAFLERLNDYKRDIGEPIPKAIARATNSYACVSNISQIKSAMRAIKEVFRKPDINKKFTDQQYMRGFKMAMNMINSNAETQRSIARGCKDTADLEAAFKVLSGLLNELLNSKNLEELTALINDNRLVDIMRIKSQQCDGQCTPDFLNPPLDINKLRVLFELRNLMYQRALDSDVLNSVPKPSSLTRDAVVDIQQALKEQLSSYNAELLSRFSPQELLLQQLALEQLSRIVEANNFDGMSVEEIYKRIYEIQLEQYQDLLKMPLNGLQQLSNLRGQAYDAYMCALLRDKLIRIRREALKVLKLKEVKDEGFTELEMFKANGTMKALLNASEIQFDGLEEREIKAIVVAIDKLLNALQENPTLELDDELLDAASIFDLRNITPTPRQLAEMLAGVANATIRMMETLSMVPAKECIALLHSALQQAILSLRKLIRHKGNNYPQGIEELCDCIPQILASAARVVPSFGANAIKLLRTNPKDILSVLAKLVNSSILLGDKAKRGEFASSSLELLGIFFDIDVTIVDKPHVSLVKAIAKLVLAIESDNAAGITELQKYIHGLNIRADVRGEKFICPRIEGPFTQQVVNALIDFVIKNTPNAFVELEKVKSSQDAVHLINGYSTVLTHAITEAKQIRNARDAKENISDLLASIGSAQSISCRGFNITGATPQVQLSSFISSISSISALCDWSKDPSRQRELRRATRSLNRTIGTLQDFLEDAEKENVDLPFIAAKIDSLQHVVKLAESVMATTSVYGNSLLPQVYNAIMSKQKSNFEKLVSSVKQSVEHVCSLNTDKSVSQSMCNCLNTITQVFTEITSTSSTSKQPDLESFVNSLIELADSITNFMVISEQLTDVKPVIPDIENAKRLPKEFVVPEIPSQTKEIPEEFASFKQSVDAHEKLIADFIAKEGRSDNTSIADKLIAILESTSTTLTHVLSISDRVMTLDVKSQITSNSVSYATVMDGLLTSVRNRLLIRGDWDSSFSMFKESSKKIMNVLKESATRALKLYEDDKQRRDSRFKQITSSMELIRKTRMSIEGKIQSIKGTSKQESWSKQMLDICVAGCRATEGSILTARAANSDMKQIVDFCTKMADACSSICKASDEMVNEENPENIVIKEMTQFAELTHVPSMGEQMILCSKAASALVATAKESLSKRKATYGGSGEYSYTHVNGLAKRGITRDWLLQKLYFESRVIRARILLRRAEEAMKIFN